MPNQGTKSRSKYPIRVIAEGLFSAYVVGRKGDRYGHYDLRLGRHAPRAHRPRPQASRLAGSRTSSVGSVDDQAIAAGHRQFSNEVGERDQSRWKVSGPTNSSPRALGPPQYVGPSLLLRIAHLFGIIERNCEMNPTIRAVANPVTFRGKVNLIALICVPDCFAAPVHRLCGSPKRNG
jgi:hypothetical protein